MTLGWLANVFILLAYLLLGRKRRDAWIFSFFGNLLWCVYAIQLNMLDVLAVDGAALILAVRAWYLWKD